MKNGRPFGDHFSLSPGPLLFLKQFNDPYDCGQVSADHHDGRDGRSPSYDPERAHQAVDASVSGCSSRGRPALHQQRNVDCACPRLQRRQIDHPPDPARAQCCCPTSAVDRQAGDHGKAPLRIRPVAFGGCRQDVREPGNDAGGNYRGRRRATPANRWPWTEAEEYSWPTLPMRMRGPGGIRQSAPARDVAGHAYALQNDRRAPWTSTGTSWSGMDA